MNEAQLELALAIRTGLSRLTLFQVGEVLAAELDSLASSLRDGFFDSTTALDYTSAATLVRQQFAAISVVTNL